MTARERSFCHRREWFVSDEAYRAARIRTELVILEAVKEATDRFADIADQWEKDACDCRGDSITIDGSEIAALIRGTAYAP